MRFASFHRVFAADVVSTFGSLMGRLAIQWLAVLALDAGPSSMALLAIADVAASAIAALALGALIDRWSSRAAMIACDLARAGALLAIPVLAAFGQLTIAWLIAVVAFNGALTVAFELAQSAWVASNVATEDLTRRNSALAAGSAVTEAASFSLAGWIYQWLGAAVAIVVDAATYLASALLLIRVEDKRARAATPSTNSTREAVRAFMTEVRDGLRTTAVDPVLRALAIVAALTAFGGSFAATTYMIYVARDLALPTGVLGVIFALGGIGSLVGSWIAARLSRSVDVRRLLIGGLFVWAIGSACAPLASPGLAFAIALLVMQQVVGDGGAIIYQITDRSLRQQHAPGDALARVDASIRTLSYGATLVGALLGGVLAEIFGARALLFASSALIAVAATAAVMALRVPAPVPTPD